jgi:FtsZ-interacting cell division protein YlmF
MIFFRRYKIMITAFEKARDFLLGNDVEEEYINEMEESMERPSFSRREKVVSMPSVNSQMQIIGFRPRTFMDVDDIAMALKERKAVLFDVNNMANFEDARRVVDFIAGVIKGIDGDMKKLTDGIFSAVPANMELSGDFMSDSSR